MDKMNLAPIVLFVYNRPYHTEQTLMALQKNDLALDSELFIFADGPKVNATIEQLEKIEQVRKVIRKKQWCGKVHIIESEENKGLADSIVGGVTDIVNDITASDINVYVDLKGLGVGTHEVSIIVTGNDPRVEYLPSVLKMKVRIYEK